MTLPSRPHRRARARRALPTSAFAAAALSFALAACSDSPTDPPDSSATPTQIVASTAHPEPALVGTSVTPAPSVIVRDANDNPVAGVSVRFVVASGGGSVTGQFATTNQAGVATVGGWTLGTVPGPNTLSATTTALAGASVTFTASALGIELVPRTIASGISHSCALDASGIAWCWGDNFYGQLGDGSNTASAEPVQVASQHAFAAITAGDRHSCGVTTAGAAYCWGRNTNYQLGADVTGNSLVPIAVSGGLTFTTISAGFASTCALTPEGIVHCWGGSDHSVRAITAPVPFVTIGSNSASTHACALTAGGAAWCWGENSTGQLGNNSTTASTAAVPVSGGHAFMDIGVGGGVMTHEAFTCGLTTSGAAWCWGVNSHGQLGRLSPTVSTPTPVTGGQIFTALSVGFNHSCGLTDEGAAYCWGRNENAQLGDNTVVNRNNPVLVTGGPNFTAISTGWERTCALATSGTAWCWGPPYTVAPSASTPQPVRNSSGLKPVTGGNHSCALNSAGAAYCWGYNIDGQLGDNSLTNRLVPVAVSGGLTFSSISGGTSHTCAVTAAAVAYCWGNNLLRQSGDTWNYDLLVPLEVIGDFSFNTITAGHAHSCALTADGAAYCWGEKAYGRLGVFYEHANALFRTPTPVTGGLSFRAISAGGSHTCALTNAGKAYCWGGNWDGTLGDNTLVDRREPVPVHGDLVFASISAGHNFTCGVTTGGEGWCWGRNSDGELGDNSTENRSTPTRVSGSLAFASISTGIFHSCGLTTSGAVYCWGRNLDGQLGTTGPGSLTPALVAGGHSYTSISAGGYHSCGATTGGIAHCWGRNNLGQLGYMREGQLVPGAKVFATPQGGG